MPERTLGCRPRLTAWFRRYQEPQRSERRGGGEGKGDTIISSDGAAGVSRFLQRSAQMPVSEGTMAVDIMTWDTVSQNKVGENMTKQEKQRMVRMQHLRLRLSSREHRRRKDSIRR